MWCKNEWWNSRRPNERETDVCLCVWSCVRVHVWAGVRSKVRPWVMENRIPLPPISIEEDKSRLWWPWYNECLADFHDFHTNLLFHKKEKERALSILEHWQPTFGQSRTQNLVPMFKLLCKQLLSWGKLLDETHFSFWVGRSLRWPIYVQFP